MNLLGKVELVVVGVWWEEDGSYSTFEAAIDGEGRRWRTTPLLKPQKMVKEEDGELLCSWSYKWQWGKKMESYFFSSNFCSYDNKLSQLLAGPSQKLIFFVSKLVNYFV